eukprot:gb/GECH01012506.1/.p1 GENE.gb/GECH01012506.1/~~gb/GECH01012506.1/.p1  ORF type:complete len:327 (+),score=72.06 gb/GECH01012506.1/:1-981(+)
MGQSFPKSKWEKGPAMSYERGNHIAMVKTTDKVQTFYVQGGNGEHDDEVEEYDQHANFKQKYSVSGANLTSGTRGHSVVTVDNTAYIFGGEDGEYFNDLNKFDMNTNTITTIQPAGSAPSPRAYHTAVVLKNKMYIFGGECPVDDTDEDPQRQYYNDIYEYDIAQNKWSKIDPDPSSYTPPARYGHTAVIHNNKSMVVFGGTNDRLLNDVLKFTFSSKKWEVIECKGVVPSPRYGHSAVVYKHIMLVFGGRTEDTENHLNDLHAFNIKNKTWQEIENESVIPRGRFLHTAVLLTNKQGGPKMIVTGGIVCDDEDEISDETYILPLK